MRHPFGIHRESPFFCTQVSYESFQELLLNALPFAGGHSLKDRFSDSGLMQHFQLTRATPYLKPAICLAFCS